MAARLTAGKKRLNAAQSEIRSCNRTEPRLRGPGAGLVSPSVLLKSNLSDSGVNDADWYVRRNCGSAVGEGLDNGASGQLTALD